MGGADDDIRDAVDDKLTFDLDVDAAESHITVETINGEVTLTGTMPDGDERTAAELLVAGLTGVRSVSNDIRIRADADQPTSLD